MMEKMTPSDAELVHLEEQATAIIRDSMADIQRIGDEGILENEEDRVIMQSALNFLVGLYHASRPPFAS